MNSLKTKSGFAFTIVIFLILITTGVCAAEEKVVIKTDYLAELNKISKPVDFDPDKNAAPYYQKAFENLVEMPSDVKAVKEIWPADMNKSQLNSVKNWLNSNSIAINHLKLAAQKPYYWREYKAESNFIFDVRMPELSKFRYAAYCLSLKSKLTAHKGNIEQSLNEVIDIYKIGSHFQGKKTLIEQLVGKGVKTTAVTTCRQILCKTKRDSSALANFQSTLQQISLESNCGIDYSAEKLNSYDNIQRIFTDCGKGGHIQGNPPDINESISICIGKEILPTLTEQQKENWANMSRESTTQCANKLYDYLDRVSRKSPAYFHRKGEDVQKTAEEMTKDNLLLSILMPNCEALLRLSSKSRAETDALIAVVALLRYKSDKGTFADSLQALVDNRYLKKLPIDPFSDKPLVYKRQKGSFILYSLGEDFDDDGGKASKWGRGEEGGDQVFWPVE